MSTGAGARRPNVLKNGRRASENRNMRLLLRFTLLLALLIAVGLLIGEARASPRLPRGDRHFWLGMSRTQVDSAIAARRETVVSQGVASLVAGSHDPAIEFVEYKFLRSAHGNESLWRVTVGYHTTVSTRDFAVARENLIGILGDPQVDTWKPADAEPRAERAPAVSQSVAWGDGLTSVHLGARWSDDPDKAADRMRVTWTDRRLQRIVAAGAKKIRKGP